MLLRVSRSVTVFGFRFSVFGFRFSVFGFRFSVFGFRFSVRKHKGDRFNLQLATRNLKLPLKYHIVLAGIAQLVEHQLPKLRVAGSSPVSRSMEVRMANVEFRIIMK